MWCAGFTKYSTALTQRLLVLHTLCHRRRALAPCTLRPCPHARRSPPICAGCSTPSPRPVQSASPLRTLCTARWHYRCNCMLQDGHTYIYIDCVSSTPVLHSPQLHTKAAPRRSDTGLWTPMWTPRPPPMGKTDIVTCHIAAVTRDTACPMLRPPRTKLERISLVTTFAKMQP